MSDSIRYTSLQQAAQWYVTLQEEGSCETLREQWQQWLGQHHEHEAAWHYVQRIGLRFAPLQAQASESGRALRQRGITRRQTGTGLLLLGLGTLTGLAGWQVAAMEGWTADLATGTGERRQLRLEDGSQLWLGARSALDTRFDTSQRGLELHFGEMLMQTSARDARPVLIQTRCGELGVAAGESRFAVLQQGELTRLDVYRGSVEVRTAQTQEHRQIPQGMGVDFSADAIGAPVRARSGGESWTRGVLVAEAMPLAQLVDTLSRYRHGYLGYSPAVAELTVMGTFPLGDTEQALCLLEQALPVRIRRLTDWWVTLDAA